MGIEVRLFQMDQQWNIIHLPERPSGFAIMVLGDSNHYVDEKTSLWKQSSDRKRFIEYLKTQGYTVFYSNMYGRHWGSPRAVTLAKRLYHYVMKCEILNDKIHILAEGMGALVALKLMEEMEGSIRSCMMLNPCLDLARHFHNEQQNLLFFKRMRREISSAHYIEEKDVEDYIKQLHPLESLQSKTPVKIWHSAASAAYSFSDHTRRYEQVRLSMNEPISLSIHLPENQFEQLQSMKDFYQSHEKFL